MDRVRASAAAGIVAVAFSLVATLGGPIAAPWFSWSTNALSDLGTSDGPERLLFTYTLITAGVSGLGFVHAIRATASGSGRAAVVP